MRVKSESIMHIQLAFQKNRDDQREGMFQEKMTDKTPKCIRNIGIQIHKALNVPRLQNNSIKMYCGETSDH